ncbi:unnamed protein product [Nesidiocoris tenuis]|uniref:Tyr recombinase domain-containing protein n=1 Tax=Nesidiocoris tenuis TaxID=355587 RepID=A0A6H5GC78_9HEMI|nr:unnamed protein product [Nesidiocoris tenuis]
MIYTQAVDEGKLLANLKRKFPDVLSKELGTTDKIMCDLKLKPDARLTTSRVIYTQGPIRQKALKEILDKLLSDGVIEPISTPSASPCFLVPKKNAAAADSWRLVVDYREVNKDLKYLQYPVPPLEAAFMHLQTAKYFTVIDLNSANHQILLTPESRQITAFQCEFGTFAYKRLPFGINKGGQVLSKLMDILFADIRRNPIDNQVNEFETDDFLNFTEEDELELADDKTPDAPPEKIPTQYQTSAVLKEFPQIFTDFNHFQQTDSVLRPIIDSISNNTNSDSRYSLVKNRLMFETKPGNLRAVVPHSLIDVIFRYFHASVIGSHWGVKRTVNAIKKFFYWPNSFKTIKSRVQECQSCLENKTETRQPKGQLSSTPDTSICLTLYIDTAGKLETPGTPEGDGDRRKRRTTPTKPQGQSLLPTTERTDASPEKLIQPSQQPTTSSCPTPYPGGRQVIREAFRRRNAPEEAIGTMIDSLSESTVSQYSSSLALWWDYCSKNNISPWSFEVEVILKFFQHVLDTRPNAYSSFNTLRSALSLISPDDIGNNVLVRRYIKGISKLRPPKPRYLNTWDPEIVLKYLEENDALGLAPLSKKLVVLLLLATGHRLQTISLIETNNVTFSDQGAKILIPSRVKTSNPNRPQPSFFLPVFSARPKLCVSTVLRTYLEATGGLRDSNSKKLFISFKKPFGPVSKDTLSRWVKDVLASSGVDTSQFSPHSTRHATTSAALRRGMSIDQIKSQAGWSQKSETFAKFYNRPLNHSDSILEHVFNIPS